MTATTPLSPLMLSFTHRLIWRELTTLSAGLSGSKRPLSTTNVDATKAALRALLRETAQPVAVATSFYPLEEGEASPSLNTNVTRKPLDRVRNEDAERAGQSSSHPRFHGATLSSFASIAMDPYPLVSFSLRIPSRLATALKSHLQHQSQKQDASQAANIVVNLLSDAQIPTATLFARPSADPFALTPHTLTEEGLPVLTGALGALSCALVSCTPLHELTECERCSSGGGEKGGVISELFILRVLRVERTLAGTDEQKVLPLVYHRRGYTTVVPPNHD